MAGARVEATGCVLTQQTNGYVLLDCWYRLASGGHTHHVLTPDLTYAEALDVLTEHLDCSRPGWQIGDGWHQAPLFG